MKELIVEEEIYVTGRGTIFICSFKCNSVERENQNEFLDQLKGSVFIHQDVPKKVKSFELMSTLMSNQNYYIDRFGVVIGSAVVGDINLKIKLLKKNEIYLSTSNP